MKKMLSIVLSLCIVWGMLISLVPVSVLAEDSDSEILPSSRPVVIETLGEIDIWDGSIATGFAGGDGTMLDPYIIETAGELAFLAQSVNAGVTYEGKYIKLAADIILNDTSAWKQWGKDITPNNSWTVIGSDYSNLFSGNFDGDGHVVRGIYINNTNAYQGLFGYVRSGIIKNLGIEKSYIKGNSYVGGIVGSSSGSGTITNCYNSGDISGSESVGGILGSGSANNCYNVGDVSGSSSVGGVVGRVDSGTVTNCYNSGDVSGSSHYVGGVAGEVWAGGTLANCFNIGDVSGSSYVGGVAGIVYDTVSNCYYLLNTANGGVNGNDIPNQATPLTEMEMKHQSSFVGWDFSYIWFLDEEFSYDDGNDEGYPKLQSFGDFSSIPSSAVWDGSAESSWEGDGTVESPFLISSAKELAGLANEVNSGNSFSGKHFKLTTDITLNNYEAFLYWQHGAIQWTAIGNNSNPFQGNFDGAGHVVRGICINNTKDYQGLFGYVRSGIIKNLGIEKSYIKGFKYVGGIVGYVYFSGIITNCYNSGDVSGSDYVGGIVGYAGSSGTVTNCHNIGDVSGSSNVGGVVGSGSANNCYNSGDISGSSRVGGVVGYAGSSGTVTNCYSSGDVSGNSYVGGVVGQGNGPVTNCYYLLNTANGGINGNDIPNQATPLTEMEMKQQSSFIGWDFSYIWFLDEEFSYNDGSNGGYPQLQSFGDFSSIPSSAVWDGSAESSWEGDGTVESPYLISSAKELAGLANEVNSGNSFSGKHFKLTTDITLNNSEAFLYWQHGAIQWTSIGNNANPFQGNFDGDNHVVSGIYINNTKDSQGLFGCVRSGIIKNLGIEKSYIKGNSRVGSVVGYVDSGTITNCYNSGDVSGDSNVGGVVGYVYSNGTVTNCYNSGDISGSSRVGGIVGRVEFRGRSTVTDCYNSGNVRGFSSVGGVAGSGTVENCHNIGDVSGNSYVGGVVGGSEGGGGITWNCYNIGDVSGFDDYVGGVVGSGSAHNCYNIGAVSGSSYVGGVVGYLWENAVYFCYNSGVVSGNGYSVGGVAGEIEDGGAYFCYNIGDVSGSSYVGGVVGYLNGYSRFFESDGSTLKDCHNTGNVSGASRVGGVTGRVSYSSVVTNCYNNGDVSGSECVGGVAGEVASSSIIINCYNSGEMNGTEEIGGVVGYIDSSGTVSNCYYLLNTANGGINGNDIPNQATPLTEPEMKQQSSFVGWDFEEVWEYGGAGAGYYYPTLRALPLSPVPNADLVESVSLTERDLELFLGDEKQLTAIVLPETAENKKLSWSSSDESIASVTESGLVTAHKAGMAIITVTTQDGGFTDSCTINVSSILSGSVVISGAASYNQILTAQVKLEDENATFIYQWLRNGVAIPGATTGSYQVTGLDINQNISVCISGTNDYSGVIHSESVVPTANNVFVVINGNTYYFINNIIVTGYQVIEGNIYYFGNDGAMGNDGEHSFHESGYIVGNNIFVTINHNTYYIINNIIVTGYQIIEGNIYYFGNDGAMGNDGEHTFHESGYIVGNNIFVTVNNNTYYIINSIIITGYRIIGGSIYHFGIDGVMSDDGKHDFHESGYIVGNNIFVTVNNNTYYIINNIIVTGYRVIGGNIYHFGTDGVMGADGEHTFHESGYIVGNNIFVTVNNNTYYIVNNIVVTGYRVIGGNIYYFGNDGTMGNDGQHTFHESGYIVGNNVFVTVNNNTYYIVNSIIITGYRIIGGNIYHFGTDGVMGADGEHDFHSNGYIAGNNIFVTVNHNTYYIINNIIVTGYRVIGGNIYHFGIDGVMSADGEHTFHSNGYIVGNNIFVTVNNNTYYIINNIIVTGYRVIGGNIYYFGNDGAMGTDGQHNFHNNGYIVGNNIFVTVNYNTYYIVNNTIITGYRIIGGNIYHFDNDGAMSADGMHDFHSNGYIVGNNIFVTVNYNTYYIVNNTIITGYRIIGGNIYHFDNDGAMSADGMHDFHSNGYIVGNNIFVTVNYNTYYIINNIIVTGYRVIGGNIYHFDNDGVMSADGKHDFHSNGYIAGNNIFVTVNNNTYYIVNNIVVTGYYVIDGSVYYFGADGVMKDVPPIAVKKNYGYRLGEFLIGVRDNTTLFDLMIGLENANMLKVYDKNENLITQLDELIGTGSTLVYSFEDIIIEQITIVVLGDISGDGVINSQDYLLAKRAFLGTVSLNKAQLKAASLSEENRVTSSDYLKIKRHFLGSYNLFDQYIM